MLFPVLEKQTISSMNSFTRSRPSRTRNMIDWNHPGEEANSCDITVHSHSPSWVSGERNLILIDGALKECTDQVRRAEHPGVPQF